MEKKIKQSAGVTVDIGALIVQDIGALASAHSPEQSTRLRSLFFLKWENHEKADVRTIIEHFRATWCNDIVGN